MIILVIIMISTKSGAGEQFLQLDRRAKALTKGVLFSQTPVCVEASGSTARLCASRPANKYTTNNNNHNHNNNNNINNTKTNPINIVA